MQPKNKYNCKAILLHDAIFDGIYVNFFIKIKN